MPASAFISYCRDDSEFALRLAQDLKDAGASVWIDQLDIEPGATWDNAIEDALIASPRMLLVLSPGSSRSSNVRNEISFALEQGKIVIPVLYKDCVVPLQLQRNNRIDFRADYARGLASLLTHLQVKQPNSAVLQQAAEDEEKRRTAWQAREAEAQRLQTLEDQKQREEVQREQRVHENAARLAEPDAARNYREEAERVAQEKASRLAKDEAARQDAKALQTREAAEQEARGAAAKLASQEAERLARADAARKAAEAEHKALQEREQDARQPAASARTTAPNNPQSDSDEPEILTVAEDSNEVPASFAQKLFHTTRGRIALISCPALFLLLVSFGICYFEGKGIRERLTATSGGDPLLRDNDGNSTQPSAWSVPFRIAGLPFRIKALRAKAEDSCRQDQNTCDSVGFFDVIQGNPKDAVALWESQCDQGIGLSCIDLGYSYDSGDLEGSYPHGEVIQQDTQKAVALFQRGCTLYTAACIDGAIILAPTGQVDVAIELLKSGCSRHSRGACNTLADWYAGSLRNVQNPKPDAALAEQYRNSH